MAYRGQGPEGVEELPELRGTDQAGRPRILQHVFHGGEGVFFAKGHRNAPGPPDAPLDAGVFEPGGRQKGDASFVQVVAAFQQGQCHLSGGFQELGIGIGAGPALHGNPVAEAFSPLYQFEGVLHSSGP